ncbi:MAG TPA: hypothetical protein VJR25_08725 [Microbacterium sp.]|uniref:hypothetical protein n=1 Tax=Microbacterium sp. TaxID=51671 RepID=UPI002B46CF65|nr:hypothetical protein [Microbacterium sp.]HKT56843.1 hypothetical protein [Microbacterium sp.]
MSTDEHSDRPVVVRVPTRGQLCWITILVLIGIVQIVRAQLFDAVFFGAAAIVTVLDATGLLPVAPARRRVAGRLLVGAGAVAAVAVGLLPRHLPAMIMVMLVLGAAVLVLVWPGSGERAPWGRGMRRLAWCWTLIVVVGCLWELFAFIAGLVDPSAPIVPALSDLLDPLLADRVGQAVFAVIWAVLGVWLVRRAVRR